MSTIRISNIEYRIPNSSSFMDRTQDLTKKNYVVESGKMKNQLPSQNSFIFYILCSSRAKVFRKNYESYPRYLGPRPRYLGRGVQDMLDPVQDILDPKYSNSNN